MRRPLVAGNWKMHGSMAFIDGYAQVLRAGRWSDAVDLLLLPPACYLERLVQALEPLPVVIGAQSVHWEASGAFTGEIAPQMAREVGAAWALVGHSERRAGQGETDAVVAAKLAGVLGAGLNAIVCVGENLAEREAGSAEAVVLRQLEVLGEGQSDPRGPETCIAYEPVWAIGTGLTATSEQAQSMHALIRQRLAEVWGDRAGSVRILYGGSVTPENAAELFSQRDVDGVLVGGASLDAEKLLRIVDAAASCGLERD